MDAMKASNLPRNIDEYLACVPEPARTTLEKVRAVIRSAVPDAEETISYRMPVFKYKGPLVGFAAFPNHCGFYVMSSTLLKTFKAELEGFETATGTIRFPVDKPLPAALIKRLVKARVAENEKRRK